jgi:uncharacterized membrane protein YbhN (UPF0104 family)
MAEFVTEPAPEQRRDLAGIIAGIVFVGVGLAYLIGGDDAFSNHWNLVLPGILVLLGVAGLAASGVLRKSAHPAAAEPENLED